MSLTLKVPVKESADPNAPKPVHPKAVRMHGLFGLPYVRQHMMIDEKWAPSAVTEEFKGMGKLLGKRLIFKKLEGKASRKSYRLINHRLKRQCRDGRAKLQMILRGENTKNIRNYLIHHKDMQRLYQHMPVHLVVDNINQRTFVMRKERDRLRCRLSQLEYKYNCKLLERAEIENRIKYQDEYVLDEEYKSREFRKCIENSNVRLQATKTVNSTYKKMIQVLQQDSIFYEPILRSLNSDIDDQSSFIKHILYLGIPAISKFKELSEEYRQMEDKVRKNLSTKVQWAANFKKSFQNRHRMSAEKSQLSNEDISKRYLRETPSMLVLRNELEKVENTIKEVKFITLCSQAKDIQPRIRALDNNNLKLKKEISNDMLGMESLLDREKCANVLKGVLVNNLTDEETKRLNKIKNLQTSIEQEDDLERQLVKHMKNRSDIYIVLRFTLWNLSDILSQVRPSLKPTTFKYPVFYLSLPLLKYEMISMRTCPPEVYEENVDEIISIVTRKLSAVMTAFHKNIKDNKISELTKKYQEYFLKQFNVDSSGSQERQDDEMFEEMPEIKTLQNVPNRKQIKALSAKLVEELSKRED